MKLLDQTTETVLRSDLGVPASGGSLVGAAPVGADVQAAATGFRRVDTAAPGAFRSWSPLIT